MDEHLFIGEDVLVERYDCWLGWRPEFEGTIVKETSHSYCIKQSTYPHIDIWVEKCGTYRRCLKIKK